MWEEEVKRYSLSFFLQQPGQLVLLVGGSMKRREISGVFFFVHEGPDPKTVLVPKTRNFFYSCT